MKKIIQIIIAIFLLHYNIYPDAAEPKPGTAFKFSSANMIYTIEIKILGHPDTSPSECTFKKQGNILWKKEVPTTPGYVNISDNGKYFVFANWGCYDEGGRKSVSFYDGDGNFLKEIEFNHMCRWIMKSCISKDGNYYITANIFKGNPQVTLYSVLNQTELWNKNLVQDLSQYKGWMDFDNILVSKTFDYFLISAFDHDEGNMFYFYLNKTGDILWQKKIKKGYPWDYLGPSNKKDFTGLSENGISFKVFNLPLNIWEKYKNINGKVELVQ